MSDLKKLFCSKSKTFSLASLLLPKAQADAVFRLYFICRKLDDWADEGNADLLQDAMDAWQNNYLMSSWTTIASFKRVGV